MELSLKDIESIVNKKIRTNQILLGISILIALIMVSLKGVYIYWSVYFILIGALNIPNINKSKNDLHCYKNNDVDSTKGEVLDLFPENEENGNWIIFLGVEGHKEPIEFVLPSKPEVQVNNNVVVHHTRILKIPFKIEATAD